MSTTQSVTNYHDSGLVRGHTYYYWLDIYDTRGHSSRSNWAIANGKNQALVLDKLNMFVSIYGQLFVSIFVFPGGLHSLSTLFFKQSVFWRCLVLCSNFIGHSLSDYLSLPAAKCFSLPTILPGFTIALCHLREFDFRHYRLDSIGGRCRYRFSGIYNGKVPALRDSIRLAMRSYLPLLFLWLLETVLVIIILYLPSHLLRI